MINPWNLDWTEECRDDLPYEAGYTDHPFAEGDTLELVMESVAEYEEDVRKQVTF